MFFEKAAEKVGVGVTYEDGYLFYAHIGIVKKVAGGVHTEIYDIGRRRGTHALSKKRYIS